MQKKMYKNMESNLHSHINGWICLDKTAGMSSNTAMIKVRKLLNAKTGYIGTLDPFATGVLPIAAGEARKFIPYVNEERKTYVFTMVFGTSTDTLDLCGQVNSVSKIIPSLKHLINSLKFFIGSQEQMPPKFSAIKINGRRACDLVRAGKEVTLTSRKISVFELKLLNESLTDQKEATLKVVCSKGTYVRSLARDIAEKLGTAAYVKSLRRTQSGFFKIKNAISLEKLQKMDNTSALSCFILPLESPLDDIPALYVSEDEARRLQNGLPVALNASACSNDANNVLIFEKHSKAFKGIGNLSVDGCEVKAVRMCSPK